MTQTIRLFMLLEAASSVAASLIHSGVFITGYEHPQASVAEGVMAVVLIVGLMLSLVRGHERLREVAVVGLNRLDASQLSYSQAGVCYVRSLRGAYDCS